MKSIVDKMGYQNVYYDDVWVDDSTEDKLRVAQRTTRHENNLKSDREVLYSKLFTRFNCILLLVLLSIVFAMFAATSSINSSSASIKIVGDLNESGASNHDIAPMFDNRGRFIMREFDLQKPIANLLSGIGGLWGVPMWAFFINRGQGVTSFGVQNKDGAIAKFLTAEKAYQQSPFTAFRTMVKGKRVGIVSKIGAGGVGFTLGVETLFNHMPFFPRRPDDNIALRLSQNLSRTMYTGRSEYEVEEVDLRNQLQTNVVYLTLVNEDFPALVRLTTFTNLHPDQTLHLEALDGLAKLLPSGLRNADVDAMGNTLQGWMNVYNTEGGQSAGDSTITQPFYHISQSTADTAEVQSVSEGHFALSYVLDTTAANDTYALLPLIVDPTVVFGYDTTLSNPAEFFRANLSTLLNKAQVTTSRTPCAYTALSTAIPPRQSVTIVSVFGHAKNLQDYLSNIAPKLRKKDYITAKRAEADHTVVEIAAKVTTNTSHAVLNSYVAQNFLDNLLRGGLPVIMGTEHSSDINAARRITATNSTVTATAPPPAVATPLPVFGDNRNRSKVFHVFSRIHGDIERDYNNFQIDTSFFSQGPGNFRDVAQNRRSDVFHTPAVRNFNVLMFLSLLQADGYNPLTVASSNFKLSVEDVPNVVKFMNLSEYERDSEAATRILSVPFRPGQLFKDLQDANIRYFASKEALLERVVRLSQQTPAAAFAQNGYWSDHWTYLLDLVNNYLSIFPDKEQELLYGTTVPFFMSPAYVRPREERYMLVDEKEEFAVGVSGALNGGSGDIPVKRSTVKQGNFLCFPADKDYSPARQNAMAAIATNSVTTTDASGAGNFWQRNADNSVATVSVFGKLLILGVLKYSTLDSQGMGVEMEGGKPGWNDAMNGLPGLLGSSMPETYEMLALLQYLLRLAKKYPAQQVMLPVETYLLLDSLHRNLLVYNTAEQLDPEHRNTTLNEFQLWNANNVARERFRDSVVATFSGGKAGVSSDKLAEVLGLFETKVLNGIARALRVSSNTISSTGSGNAPSFALSPTYFYYQCSQYIVLPPTQVTVPAQATQVQVLAFKQHSLPLFLEGPTKHMKIAPDIETKRAIYQGVKNSGVYDKELKMFKLSASLAEVDREVGRIKAFSPGWLENQSVWLHMSYKFYLELLRGGLYDEFFAEIATGLVPFMDAKRYGRSPLEAASFIVSSEFPDRELWGSSHLARLSGSTAEFLSMWIVMMVGQERDGPFTFVNNTLQLRFSPKLAAWMFHPSDDTLSFMFLGAVKVTYHNPRRQHTWLLAVASMTLEDKAGAKVLVEGSVLPSELAVKVRELQFVAIHVVLM